MSLLSDGEIAGMRATANEAMPSTAIIRRLTQVSDGQGGQTDSWAAAGTVICRLDPRANETGESEAGGRPLGVGEFTVTLPAGTGVTSRDRLEIESVSYEVVTMRSPRSWELTRRVDVVQLD